MNPSMFIQWKGTDVCIELTCPCGYDGHYDGFFLYAWRCPECRRVWVMPWHIEPHEASAEELEQVIIQDGEREVSSEIPGCK